jgi:hypothetical protein
VAKDKDKPDGKKKQGGKPAKSTASKIREKTVELASNPAVTEVVAATLVAAAAALKNPQKARALAASASDEIEKASKEMADKGNVLWQLAMEVAKRSMKVIGGDEKSKKGRKKDGKKKDGKKKKK